MSSAEERRAKIIRRTVTGFTLAGVLALLLVLAAQPWGGTLTALMAALLASLGAVEAMKMRALPDMRAVFATMAATLAVALIVIGGQGETRIPLPEAGTSARYWALVGMALGAPVLVALVDGLVARRAPWRLGPVMLWLAVPLPLLGLVRDQYGAGALTALIVLSKVGDVAGYYGGQALGGTFPTHPFPKLSPGKTTVGCVCSLIAGTGAGVLFAVWGVLPEASWLQGAIVGATLNVASQAGDLLESAAKRRGGVKDAGTWFGPSGGMLDLTDSLLLSVPVAVLTWPLILG